MATSHPHLFQRFNVDENEICKLVKNHFLIDRAMLQWPPAAGEDMPTPNTKEIIVFSPFLPGLQIELVHLNPNSILQIMVFVHRCEAFLGIPPNFPLFKHYFLKYQLSTSNRKVIGGVGLQTCPRCGFLELPIKTSLWGWHMTWFCCENHEPSLPSFIGRLPEYQGTWGEEPTPVELPHIATLTNTINALKEHVQIGVCLATHWLARQVIRLKK
jgi:hypothetical protein